VILDESLLDPAWLAATERTGPLRALATAGAQIREGLQLADESEVDSYLVGMRPRAVLVCCDPATEVAARTVEALARQPDCPTPVLLHSDPDLPMWAGPADLLLVSAHAGDDERVLATVQRAARRGVSVAGVGPAPSQLEEACLRARGGYVPVPGGRPARAALWGVLAPLVRMAGRIGVAAVSADDLSAAADLLNEISMRCRPSSDTFVNPAKSLALTLAPTLPVLWGTTPLTGVAAYRAATQFAGNAGMPALSGTLPAAARLYGGVLDNPESAGMEDLFRDRVEQEDEPRRPRLVVLHDTEESPDVRAELDTITGTLSERAAPLTELAPDEGGPITRLASLIGLIDFVSVYAGLVLGVDPAAGRLGQGAA
jgi:glucose/mannose-6-phosphate isomerase